MSEPTVRNHCRHIHPSGHRCASPSLRQEPFCYYHHATRRAISKSVAQSRQAHHSTFTLLEPDNRTAIQLNLGEIMRRLAAHELDPKRAGLLLYALQIAACNLPKSLAQAPETIEDITLDEQLGPLAPESEYQSAPGQKTLEQILREQWAQDDIDEAARQNEVPHDHEAEGEVILGETPPQTLPTIQAVADTHPSPFIHTYPSYPRSHYLCGITEVCSFTSSGSGNFVGPSTAIRGSGPLTIATSSHA